MSITVVGTGRRGTGAGDIRGGHTRGYAGGPVAGDIRGEASSGGGEGVKGSGRGQG